MTGVESQPGETADTEPVPVNLRLALTVALFASVVVFATVMWVTVHPLAGAAALLVPFAAWYSAHVKAEANRQAHERALEISKAKAGPATRPAIPTRPPLDEGGTVGQAPWAPGSGYGAA